MPRLTNYCVLQVETHLRTSPKQRKHEVFDQHVTLFKSVAARLSLCLGRTQNCVNLAIITVTNLRKFRGEASGVTDLITGGCCWGACCKGY